MSLCSGFSLYIRPTAIGTSPYLGVQAASHAKVFVILSPVGPYYKSGFVPIRLYADALNVRAWPGGAGNTKVGGNYAPTIAPSRDAIEKHECSQVLWLFGDDHKITEVGAMNICFVFKKDDGSLELATAPLTNGDILPGVTRDSVLAIARGWQGEEAITVSERYVTMDEVVSASKSGKVNTIMQITHHHADVVPAISACGSIWLRHCCRRVSCSRHSLQVSYLDDDLIMIMCTVM